MLKKNRSITEDFTKLHLELKNEGYFEPSYLQGFLRVVELFFWAGMGLVLFHNQRQVLGLLAITTARFRTAWLIHECGHYSYTGRPKVDRVLSTFLYGEHRT